MLEFHQVVDGRPCTLAYLTEELTPATKEDFTFVKVIFDDGEVAFLVNPDKAENKPADGGVQEAV